MTNKNNKIFVSIACYMDKDIINTIEDCLSKAKNPDRVFLEYVYSLTQMIPFSKNMISIRELELKKCIGKKQTGLCTQDISVHNS